MSTGRAADRWTRVAAAVLAAFILGLTFLDFVALFSHPDPGFSCDFSDGAVPPSSECVIQTVKAGGPADIAGLRPGDVVVSGEPQAGPDGTLQADLVISRPDSAPFDVHFAAGPPPVGVAVRSGAVQQAVGLAVRAILIGVIVVVVAFAKPGAPGVRALLACGAAVAVVFSLSSPLVSPLEARLQVPIFADHATVIDAVLVPELVALACCAILHLSLVVPTRRPLLDKLDTVVPGRLGAVPMLYALAAIAMLLVDFIPYPVEGGYDAYYAASSGLYLVLLIPGLLIFARSYWRPVTPLARAQLRWLMIAVAIVVAVFTAQAAWGAVTGKALPEVFGDPTQNAAVLFFGGIAFAVLRYRLFDVDRFLRLTVTWLVLAAILLGGFLVLTFLGSRAAVVIAGPDAATDPTASVIAALVVAGVANPGYQRLQSLLDELVFRERAARRRLLHEANDVLGRAQPPEAVEAFLTQEAPRSLGIRIAWLALVASARSESGSVGEGGHDTLRVVAPALAERIASSAGPCLLAAPGDDTIYADADMPSVPADDPALTSWYAAGARLLVPLGQGARVEATPADPNQALGVVGIWVLGLREPGTLPERDDLMLLDRIAGLAPLLIEVQAAGRRQGRLDRELRVARVVQHTLLPSDGPRLIGWRVAAHYQAAAVIGGDFYDFVQLPGGRWGIAVGDVSGKGIPAALVMASTQSLLRVAAISGAPPGKVLAQTNAWLHARLPKQVFVTCHYGILDPGTGELQYANAGHCPPVWRSGRSAVELLAPGLPLGVADDTCYSDQRVQIKPEDSLLLYSDGVVEARDSAGNVFGFDRLLDLVAKTDPGKIVDVILADLERFRGSTGLPEDDITLLMLDRA